MAASEENMAEICLSKLSSKKATRLRFRQTKRSVAAFPMI